MCMASRNISSYLTIIFRQFEDNQIDKTVTGRNKTDIKENDKHYEQH